MMASGGLGGCRLRNFSKTVSAGRVGWFLYCSAAEPRDISPSFRKLLLMFSLILSCSSVRLFPGLANFLVSKVLRVNSDQLFARIKLHRVDKLVSVIIGVSSTRGRRIAFLHQAESCTLSSLLNCS